MTASLEAATLRTAKDGPSFPATKLWADSPVLVVVLRRPGCLLCREEAITLWSERAKFEQCGLKLVCVVHEWLDREIKAFAPAYWGGDLYYDESKAFYKAVHGGSVKKGSLLALLNPFGDAWGNMKRAKKAGIVKDSNINGDGLTLGGVLVLKQGGEIVYSHAEKTFGDHPPIEEVFAAAHKAGGSS